ncbi:GNAT family N-acetyltransferase [Mesorhizobium sp. 1M-11]|uniref:GNAT family N-acetyltransferase n=1 Tax=Mesorhizobium sp. 1M-11 TaxID=1529006 RepID=UPI0006C750BC|nr:GNAT family N-acetyltransferase [Mesorhizobium sp. 1M-11]
MSLFSQEIVDFWKKPFADGEVLYEDQTLLLTVNPALGEDERVTVLETVHGKVLVALTPEMAARANLSRQQELSEVIFRGKLDEAGIRLHGADYLFYFRESERAALAQESIDAARQLSQRDEAVFAAFQAAATEQDLDDAYVELNHWAVFGAFEEECLVSAASAYPWSGSKLADIGVLTLVPFRGRGHARKAVRALSRYAFGQGYEPQYRCQTDNLASTALAKACGLTLFGKSQYVSPDSTV